MFTFIYSVQAARSQQKKMTNLNEFSDREWIELLSPSMHNFSDLQRRYGIIKKLTIQVRSDGKRFGENREEYIKAIVYDLAVEQKGELVQIPANWIIDLDTSKYTTNTVSFFIDLIL